MDLLAVIKTRRSIRKFKEDKVDKETIKKIIEAGIYAPSNCNIQGWRFIVIEKQEIKDKIVESGGTINIKTAPIGILVLYDNRSQNFEYKDYIQSASAAIENIFLMAVNIGLGCCWINHLPPKKKLRKILNIPKVFSPIAYLLIGYPKYKPIEVPRKYPLGKLISYNIFSENIAIERINQENLFIKKILIKIYYLTPVFLKKHFLNKFLDKHFVKKFGN